MKQYHLMKTIDKLLSGGSVFEKAPVAAMDIYPWGGTYCPKAEAQLIYTDNAFHLRLKTVEPREKMRAEARGISPDVYQDSCMELFFMPAPDKDQRYINLEFNPAGALYVGIGTCRKDNHLLIEQDISVFNIKTFSEETSKVEVCWGITATIPFSFLDEQFGPIDFHTGHRMLGNFYKCGDGTETPHYGVWSPIYCPNPDYHRPEFFGELLL